MIKYKVSDFVLNTEKILKQEKLSLNKLSTISGISKGVLSAILNGYYNPNNYHLLGIAVALDVEVKDLIKENI